MAYVDRDWARERGASGVAAAVAVAAVGYAVVHGLAVNILPMREPPLIVQSWTKPLPPPPPPAPARSRSRTTTSATASQRPAATPEEHVPTVELPAVASAGEATASAASGSIPSLPPTTPPVDRSAGATPRGDPGRWVREEDYPVTALRSGVEGRTSVRIDVGADGRPAGCAVTATSGSADLDAAACRMLMRRARFVPARDAGGGATASTYSSNVQWRLPRD